MQTHQNFDNDYRIAIFSELKSPARLQQIFSEQLNVDCVAPNSWLVHVPGILNETFSKDEATQLVRALNAEGLDTVLVSPADVLDMHACISIVDARCSREGLSFSDLNRVHVGQIPWSAVRMICVGEVLPTIAQARSTNAGQKDGSRAAQTGAHNESLEHGLELIIACQRPHPNLSLHHKLMKHEYLGLRRAAWTKIDFRDFVNEVIRCAPHAVVTQSTADYLRHVRHGRQEFLNLDELLRYASLHAVRAMTTAEKVKQPCIPSS